LVGFTLCKLLVFFNGAKAGSPRAATGFARNEEYNAGRLAQIWFEIVLLNSWPQECTESCCRHLLPFRELKTPGALNELDRARNSIFSHPREAETAAELIEAIAAMEEAILKAYYSGNMHYSSPPPRRLASSSSSSTLAQAGFFFYCRKGHRVSRADGPAQLVGR
jgi:hypothetical protein